MTTQITSDTTIQVTVGNQVYSRVIGYALQSERNYTDVNMTIVYPPGCGALYSTYTDNLYVGIADANWHYMKPNNGTIRNGQFVEKLGTNIAYNGGPILIDCMSQTTRNFFQFISNVTATIQTVDIAGSAQSADGGPYAGYIAAGVGNNKTGTTIYEPHLDILPIQYWVKNRIVYFREPTVNCTFPNNENISLDSLTGERQEIEIVLSGICEGPVSGTVTISGGTNDGEKVTISDSVATTTAACEQPSGITKTTCDISGTTPTARFRVGVQAEAGNTGGNYSHTYILTWSWD
jgi:hypothetical protein